jgi:hypothetical protein
VGRPTNLAAELPLAKASRGGAVTPVWWARRGGPGALGRRLGPSLLQEGFGNRPPTSYGNRGQAGCDRLVAHAVKSAPPVHVVHEGTGGASAQMLASAGGKCKRGLRYGLFTREHRAGGDRS